LNSRKSKPSCPEKAFQRALSGHITGVDGRVPFDQEEEEAILRAVRRKARWECFRHCDIKFGESGFRTKGFHEKAYAGEILKTQPKKRAKRAMEKIRNISRSLLLEEQRREEEEDDEVEENEEAESSSNESSATSPSSSSASSERRRKKVSSKRSAAAASTLLHQQQSGAASSARYPFRNNSTMGPPPMVQQLSTERGRSESSSSSASSTVYYPHSVYESSTSVLTMNIPSVVGTPISAAASTLLGMLVNMVLSLGALGLPYAKIVLALHRTIIYSRGWFASPKMDQAQALMAKLKQQHPDDYIILCDFTQDPLNRYLLQNDLAIEMFGKISQEHGGCKGLRVSPTEIWNVLKTYSEAGTLPSGQEARGELTLVVRSEDRLCEVFISMDDETHIIVERGRLMDGPLRRGRCPSVPAATKNVPSSSSFGAQQVPAGGLFLNLAKDLPNKFQRT
jgi:hypothetical protein